MVLVALARVKMGKWGAGLPEEAFVVGGTNNQSLNCCLRNVFN